MARDFAKELAVAVASQDVAALAALAYQLLGKVEHDDARRARMAEKKRLERVSRDVVRQSATGATAETSAKTLEMSRDVAGRRATSGDVADSSPPLKEILTTTPPTAGAREVIAELGDDKLQRALTRLRDLMGEQWVDVAEFLLRRKYDTWQGWADVMVRDVGVGSQFTPDDLATVCRDDATLEKRIGSAGVLRTFLGYARRERLEAARSPPGVPPIGAPRSGSTSRRDTKPPPQRYDYPAPTTAEPKWQK